MVYVVFGSDRSRIRKISVSTAVVVAFGTTVLAPSFLEDYIDRPVYLHLIEHVSYTVRVVTYCWTYYWTLKHRERIRPLIDVNLSDQLLFFPSTIGDVCVAVADVRDALVYGDSVTKSLTAVVAYSVCHAV